jgi:tetratricopeptide (TPR) repeat protein
VVTGELSIDTVFAEIASTIRRNATPTGTVLRAVEFASHVDERWQDRFAALREHVLDAVPPLLLVVDNFEDNLTDAPTGRQVRDETLAGLITMWTDDPGRSRLLFTSRYPFTLPDHAEDSLLFHPVGPMSQAETFKLVWSLPALDRLTDAELERVWWMVGGHPRALEYLDALLAGGHARFADITRRITRTLRERHPDDADRLLSTSTTLDQAMATTLTLAADDVLLDHLLAALAGTPDAEQLLLGLSVYREPVDRHAALFQIGASDPTAAHIPDYRSANDQIKQILTRHHIPTDRPVNAYDLPPNVLDELSPHLQVLDHTPTPPIRFDGDLHNLIAVLQTASLLTVTSGGQHLFVHRWTASELDRRWTAHARSHELTTAHQYAASYWRWRVETWPQDSQADAHDLLEARHHLISAGDLEPAATMTEYVCSWLHQTGAWDHESELIHDTLRWLSPDSPRHPAWIHQLGTLARNRGDYSEAERRFTQSLEINQRLGNQVGMALSYHQLGILAEGRGDYPEAERRYTQALEINQRLGNQADMANSYHQLGILAEGRGDYPEAERRYTQALEINQRLGNQAGIAATVSQQASLALARNDLVTAMANQLRALSIRLKLQAPQAARNLRALRDIRTRLGIDHFHRQARSLLDADSLDALTQLLDQIED